MLGLSSKGMKTEQQLADELMAQMGVVRSDLKALALLVIAGALVALAGDEVDWVGLIVISWAQFAPSLTLSNGILWPWMA